MNLDVSLWHLGAAVDGAVCSLLPPLAAAQDTVAVWAVPGHVSAPYRPPVVGHPVGLLFERACVALVVTVVCYEALLQRKWMSEGWFTSLLVLEYGLACAVLVVARVVGPVDSFSRWGWFAATIALQTGVTAALAWAGRRWATRPWAPAGAERP
jgi:hypothetical protein